MFINLPFIRMWLNCFNYKTPLKRKDYIIDLVLLVCTFVLLILLSINLHRNFDIPVVVLVLFCCAYFFIPFLSMSFRRIKDTGNPPFLAFLSLLNILILIFVIIICCFKSKEDYQEEEFKKRNKKKLNIAAVVACSPIILVYLIPFVTLFYDATFLAHGKITYLNTEITDYEEELKKVENADKMMPKLDSLGDYSLVKSAAMEKMYSITLGFFSNSISLYVNYDLNFSLEKERVLNEYDFLEEPIGYNIPLANFSYNGYDYRIVPDEDYIDFVPCKSFMLIGFENNKNQIAYHYFYDFDIDYIAHQGDNLEERMCDFMKDNFYYFDD